MVQCESCVYYDYDEESEMYVCMKELDEDEYERFTQSRTADCPFYKLYDEYKTVRKQN
ncbi:MAG TPA: DUF6472 family protein [Bacillota bacterium]|nr:DUF6472 family protein [Bacillota bacterium]